jgi:hypothetical protein
MNLISNLAAGGIYATKIICILRSVTRGRRIVAANLIGNFGPVTADGGVYATKLSGILVPVTRELRNRCNEFYWHSG